MIFLIKKILQSIIYIEPFASYEDMKLTKIYKKKKPTKKQTYRLVEDSLTQNLIHLNKFTSEQIILLKGLIRT